MHYPLSLQTISGFFFINFMNFDKKIMTQETFQELKNIKKFVLRKNILSILHCLKIACAKNSKACKFEENGCICVKFIVNGSERLQNSNEYKNYFQFFGRFLLKSVHSSLKLIMP